MVKSKPFNQKFGPVGFTLAEGLLVLAVASIILAVVFLAIPSLQRSARNNQRKTIASNVFAAINNYHNDTNTYPWAPSGAALSAGITYWYEFYNKYVSSTLNDTDPSTGKSIFYTPYDSAGHINPDTDDADSCSDPGPGTVPAGQPCVVDEAPPHLLVGVAAFIYDAKCDGSLPVSTGTYTLNYAGQKFAMVMGLEPTGTYFCLDNQ